MRLHYLLALVLVLASTSVLADTTAPYSKPFHKQGRGWYPSIYWSTGRNLGSFYFPNTNGRPFEPLSEDDWDKETNGLVYFYRPQSQWADEELEAPSYYINDLNVFNLRSGSWTVVELPAGNYDITGRKGVLPLIGFESFDDKLMMAFDLNLLGDIGLAVDPGSVHYFRHSEVSLPKRLHPDLDPEDEMATADLQMVDEELALKEMKGTRYLEHSFWTPNDSAQIRAMLEGDYQDYGWFSIIWPWSNNFLFGFPLWNLPSDMFKELRGEPELTLEQKLYRLADDPEEYLAAIEEMRQPKRNWLAPWRKPVTGLTLNDELTLDRLEREARAGNIKPALPEPPKPGEPGLWWFWPPGKPNYETVVSFDDRLQRMHSERRAEAQRISESLN